MRSVAAGRGSGDRRGEVLVTHEGLSGPGILDASRGLEPGDLLELDFTGIGVEAFRSDLAARVAAAPRAFARTVLSEAGLPKRVSELICSLAGQDQDARCAQLRRDGREAMASYATGIPGGDRDHRNSTAMATAGGVSLDEVDPGSMESRVEEGLYFAGEVLDYDGDTGGYNLRRPSRRRPLPRAQSRRDWPGPGRPPSTVPLAACFCRWLRAASR